MKASKFSDAQKAFIIKQRGRWDAGRGDFRKAGISQATPSQPKNVAHAADATLLNRARQRLVRLARKHGIALPQS